MSLLETRTLWEKSVSVDKSNGINCHVIYGLYEGMNVGAFHQYLADSVDILSYWNHLPLVYFVKTRLNSHELTNKLLPFFDKRLFIVAEVDAGTISGWLPMNAWEWFKTPAPPFRAPRPAGFLANLYKPT
jgi:hypothetical protein